MKKQVVINSCVNDLSPTDERFMSDYQDMRCNDVTRNGCYLDVYRKYRIFTHIKGKCEGYPSMEGYYLGDNCGITTTAQVDNLNEMMADFFKRNKIEDDSFLYYVSW